MNESRTFEEALASHRRARRVREAIVYVRARTEDGDGEALRWACGEVLGAAEEYADCLEARAASLAAAEARPEGEA